VTITIKWNIPGLSRQTNGRPSWFLHFQSKKATEALFLSKNFGLMVCEDYLNSSIFSEIQTENMQVTSIDYSFSSEAQVLITYSTGHLLLISPIHRSRGKIVWLNSRKNIYSTRVPSIGRWVNENQFLVLFGDNLMWKFDKRLSGEDEKFISAAQNNVKDCHEEIVVIAHPSPQANPTAL
jgi:hypothetical protein